MPINWQEIITTIVATVGGGGVVLAAVAWLTKALISNRLALDADKFKIKIKADADTEIERVKAFLIRASRVHERQLPILVNLYRHLYDAQGYFQRMTSSGRAGTLTFDGKEVHEITPEEYAPLLDKELAAVREEFLNGRLLMPPVLVQQCEGFFNALSEGQRNFTFAYHPMMDPAKRAEFWSAAVKVAFQDVPKILQQIEKAARDVIHGEPPE